MTLYRNPGTEDIWTAEELTASLRAEIAGLDDEDSLKQEVELHGDAAISEYITECCLVGIYSRVGDGHSLAYQRVSDGSVFYAAEVEQVYRETVAEAGFNSGNVTPFGKWLSDVLDEGEFIVVNADDH